MKTTEKNALLEQAKKLGTEAFDKGLGSAPVLNKELWQLCLPFMNTETRVFINVMKAYTNAWTVANLNKNRELFFPKNNKGHEC